MDRSVKLRRAIFVFAALAAAALCAYVWQTQVGWPQATTDRDTVPVSPVSCVRSQPLLVAPIFHTARDRGRSPEVHARALAAQLDRLEPGGPVGDVVLGHTVTIDILGLFHRDAAGEWTIDPQALEDQLMPLRQIERPAVVYLMANHFSRDSPLVRQLRKNPVNLMAKADGSPPESSYFGTTVQPFTLSTDDSVPVNRSRFQGLRQIVTALRDIDQRLPGRIAAITLGGEIHHLFDGLQENTGKFSRIGYTDYSALAVAEYRRWLRQRHGGDIATLNTRFGTPFATWDDVDPPRGDIRDGPIRGFWDHMDANASGSLPIQGWIDIDAGVSGVRVEVDGTYAGHAQLGINRLDVYQARQDIHNPNTGFRFDLDLGTQEPGMHDIRLIAEMSNGTRLEIARRRFARMSAEQTLPAPSLARRLRQWLRRDHALPPLPADQFWVDSPRDLQDAYYNPYAVEWHAFRQDQVRLHLAKLFEIAADAGFDRTRLFSHQLLPHLNGGWNDVLFAAGRSFDKAPFAIGVTLYGGLTLSPLAIASARGQAYGVPEMHPLLYKDAQGAERALAFAQQHCARFLSPMYMVEDSATVPAETVNVFSIGREHAPVQGQLFYAAIERFVRQ